MINRRLFALMLLAAFAVPPSGKAWAKDDGGDDGGKDGGGRGDDGGKDDDGKDDGGKDDGRDESDDSKENSTETDEDDDRIRRAVRDGKAQPLRTILKKVRARFQAQVVRVKLTKRGSALLYRIRMIDSNNRLIDVLVEAASGDIITPLGVY